MDFGGKSLAADLFLDDEADTTHPTFAEVAMHANDLLIWLQLCIGKRHSGQMCIPAICMRLVHRFAENGWFSRLAEDEASDVFALAEILVLLELDLGDFAATQIDDAASLHVAVAAIDECFLASRELGSESSKSLHAFTS